MNRKACIAAALLALGLAPAAWAGPLVSGSPACTAATAGFSYIDCAGSFSGNLGGSLSADQIGVLNAQFADNGFTYSANMLYSKSDSSGNGVFSDSGTDFSLNFDAGKKATGLFVIGLKQATRYSFYLIDGGAAGLSEINFNVNGVVGSPQNNGLSHAVYVGNALSVASTPPGSQADQTVPEPQTLTLLAMGLGAIAWVGRRRVR